MGYGGSGFATKGETEEGLNLPTKKLSPPLYATSHPCLIAYQKLKKILPKIVPLVHIFSFTIMTYLKNFIGIEFLSRKQCPGESSPSIIPPAFSILLKMFLLLPPFLFLPPHSPNMWTDLPFTQTYHFEETL